MRINQNISAMNTHASMLRADNNISKSLERLSSGLRINRAADDAAGLAISEKMRGQIRGLQQATKNAQDGISLLQTAEGALNESHSILQRMRELSVQAANDTLTSSDRAEIQKEMDQLTKEVDRIAGTTEFNTKKLLRGDQARVAVSGTAISGAVDANATGTYTMAGGVDGTSAASGELDFSALTNFFSGQDVTINATTLTAGEDFAVGSSLSASLANLATAIDADATLGAAYNATLNAGSDGITLTAAAVGAAGNAANLDLNWTGKVATGTVTLNDVPQVGDTLTINGNTYSFVNGSTNNGLNVGVGSSLNDTLANLVSSITANDGTNFAATVNSSGNGISLTYQGAGNAAAQNAIGMATNVTAGTTLDLTMHIGANAGQAMSIQLSNMDAGSLGIGRNANGTATTAGTDAVQGLDVTTQAAANATMTKIDAAIQKISQERSRLGAFQNRLDHTISNLGAASENLSSSESRIRDVDMADEMANFSRAQILMQASTAMMAQANQKPQAVLKLLG